MSIRQKLIFAFLVVTMLVFTVGFFGLIASKQITKAFEGGEQQFRTIVSAATEVSSYVKRAESHLMLYLMLHDNVDKGRYYNRYSSLKEQIVLLDGLVTNPEARLILDSIKFDVEELMPIGRALIEAHDREVMISGIFQHEKNIELIKSFNEVSSSIRHKGIALANYETDFLNRQEAITASTEISSYIKRAEGDLMMYLSLHEKEDRDKFFDRLESLTKQISSLEKRIKGPDAREILTRIENNVSKILPIAKRLIKAHDVEIKTASGFQFKKYIELIRNFHSYAEEILEDGFKLTEINIKLESQKKDDALTQANRIQNIILIIIFASVIISIFLGYLLSRIISNPLMQLRKAATLIGSGKLDTSIDIHSKDEIGSLATSFTSMAESLQTTMVSKSYVDNIITSMMDSLVVIDTMGRIRTVNRALCLMLDYREDELIGQPIQNIFGEEYNFMSDLNVLKEQGYLSNREETYLTKMKAKIPVLFSGSLIHDVDRSIKGIVYVALDITNRKVVEEKLRKSREQLRDLLAYLQSVREHERTEFAREIHDELGQSLTALKMDLHWLGKKFQTHAAIAGKTQSMLRLVDKTIITVKKICTELRPGVLDDLGLTAAIEWQAGEFEKRSGIVCNLLIEPEDIMLDKDRSTAIFRIFQETLTNVARHAAASEVNVNLIQRNGVLEMEVKDNGRGIKETEIADAKSFGLIGMKERALLLGGEFRINGITNEGTTVIVRVPV